MKVYQVGGAVRDELLGLAVKDRDYVVVGATPEEMERLGFRPVGKDFPVFLHPRTHEEYALARTERKSGRGYKGFTVHAAPEVTLDEDLARRDLTINAIAKDDAGTIIDPHGGCADLRAGILRHVSPAFVEDPVRLLRVARFAARFGFAVAPQTRALMRAMVDNGEVDALVPERVWQELSRGLMEREPVRMLDELADVGALVRVLPEWSQVNSAAARAGLGSAAMNDRALPVRYATLFAQASVAAVESANARLRAPADCAEVAAHVAAQSATLDAVATLPAGDIVGVLQRLDALRRPDRFERILEALEALGGPSAADRAQRWRVASRAASTIDAGAIAQANRGHEADAVRAARIAAVDAALFP